MKGGKGNTFSTSLNKSFFLSFFLSFFSYFSLSFARIESSPKIDQSQLTIEYTRERWANVGKQAYICAQSLMQY